MILFVDDDPRSLAPYVEELEACGYEVRLVSSVDDALALLGEEAAPIDLVVWDMMMPPGDAFANRNTEGGLRTGEVFFDELRRLRPTLPAILFTNRRLARFRGKFSDDPHCVLSTKDQLPGEFAIVIAEVIAQHGARGG